MKNKEMAKKILILTGGPRKKLDSFLEPIKRLGLDVFLASFCDIHFFADNSGNKLSIKVGSNDLSDFNLIYIRMVGKRLEDATLVVNYAKERGIKIVDKLYEDSLFIPSSITKAMEMKKLADNGVSMPPTYFGSLALIGENSATLLGMPYVVKSTSGKKARDVWLVKDKKEFEELYNTLREREKEGVCFFAQSLVASSQRVRVLVVGEKALGAITRPTKWRKTFIEKQNGEFPDGVKESIFPVPEKYSELAIRAAKATGLDISGVDILEDDKTRSLYVIEANAAPSWNLIKKDCQIDVEEEILKFLSSKL